MYDKAISFSFFKLSTIVNPDFVASLCTEESIAKNLAAIYTHPFNQQLFKGELTPEEFGKYLHDDYIYLLAYAKTLQLIAEKIKETDNALAEKLLNLATEIVAGEQSMQESYAQYFTYTPGANAGKAISAYIAFLENHITSNPAVALCSVLPCFWIYRTLGAHQLSENELNSNPYADWIKTYSEEGFVTVAENLKSLINELAKKVDDEQLRQMHDAFEQAVHYELQFFDEVCPEEKNTQQLKYG